MTRPSYGRAPALGPVVERWVGRILLFGLIVALAVIAGLQFAQPDKRILQVAAAAVVVYFAFRSTSIAALTLAVLFMPFPKGTSYGNTNVAFLLLIFVVWLFRVGTGRVRPAGRTPIDVPLLGLLMAYGLSFYNVLPANMSLALSALANLFTYVFCMYMVINIVRTSDDVRRILVAQTVSCFLVCLFALYEQARPGTALVPGWIDFTGTYTSLGQGVRVGSTFRDYELFGEYCAMNLILQLFHIQRVSTQSRRWMLVAQMLLTVYCLFATVTRGAIITFVVGLLYLSWLSRTRLNFVRVVSAVALVLGLIGGGDFVMSHYTNSKSVLTRLFATHLENGMPDSRAPAWKAVWERVQQSPVIGHGPYYSLEKGFGLEWWPHNVYLYYAYIVGFVGLAFFLWFLVRIWRWSRPRAASLGSGSYADGATLLMRVMFLMFLVDQLKIDYLRNGVYSYFAWFLFGLIIAVSNVARLEAATSAATASALPAGRPVRVPALAHPPAIAASPAVPRA
jgi:O-antigen ligase